jgi:PAS domain S-box-containing protein
MMELGEFVHTCIKVVGVADLDSQAVGLSLARERGIFTTAEPRQLLDLPNLDLVIELAGQEEVLRDLAASGPVGARVVNRLASHLVADLVLAVQRLRLSEDQCRQAGALAHTLTSVTSEGVMVLDPNYRIRRINQVAVDKAGLSEEEALGRYCFQVSHQAMGPCDSPESPCPMKRTLETRVSAHAIHRHTDAAGASRYCDVSTYPVLDRSGQVVEVLEVMRDITSDLDDQVERRTRALKQDLARLVREDKLISLGKMVASVAHEINNPIGSIINFSKLILKSIRDHAPTEQELVVFDKWLDLTAREAQRCGRIVLNLLTFARQQGVEHRRVNLADLLDTILTLVRHRMDLAEVDLDLKLEDGELTVWGDYNQLQQCLSNLVFNALEAMPGGGVLGVAAGRVPGGEAVLVRVADSGHGIAPEHLPYIFEPFFSTKEQGQGVGLGLAMVYGIIEDHGGSIEVLSAPGEGAAFNVTLPSGPRPGKAAAGHKGEIPSVA